MSFTRQVIGAAVAGGATVTVAGAVLWRSTNSELSRKPNDPRLLSAHVVFRHGARTPIAPWNQELNHSEQDPIDWADSVPTTEDTESRIPVTLIKPDGEKIGQLHWGKSTWKTAPKSGHPSGELTELGYEQAVALGKSLRERYIVQADLIPNVYTPKLIYARSTNFNRTKQTCQGVLSGMFGTTQPAEEVTLQVVPWYEEVIVANSRICSTYKELCNHISVSRFGAIVAEERRLVMDKLNVPQDKLHFVFLRDVLVARTAHGKPVPPGITPELYDAIDVAGTKTFHAGFHGEHRVPALQASCGVLLNTVLTNIHSKREDKPVLYLFSAHDSLLSPLLAALGADDSKWPPYASSIAFELYQQQDNSDEKFVKVLYNGEVVLVDGCSSVNCPLNEFATSMKRYAIDKDRYRELCKDSQYKGLASSGSQKATTYL